MLRQSIALACFVRSPGRQVFFLSLSALRIEMLLGAVVAAAVLSGMVYQRVATARDRRRFLPPGQLIDIGGPSLHLHCLGQGRPLVVFEAGLGNNALVWRRVQREVATITATCSYDRAGLGWSTVAREPRTADRISTELHAALRCANLAGPYIVVAHSFGGVYARKFVEKYRDEVVGLLLIDTVPSPGATFSSAADTAAIRWTTPVARWLAPLGIVRLAVKRRLSAQLERFLARHEPDVQDAARTMYCHNRTWITSWEEVRSRAASFAELKAAENFGDLPMMVIVSGAEAEAEAWMRSQARLLELSSRSSLVRAEQSGHYVQLEDPDLVEAEIKRLVTASSSASSVVNLPSLR